MSGSNSRGSLIAITIVLDGERVWRREQMRSANIGVVNTISHFGALPIRRSNTCIGHWFVRFGPIDPCLPEISGYQSDSVFHASSFMLVARSMDLQQFCRVVFDDIRHP